MTHPLARMLGLLTHLAPLRFRAAAARRLYHITHDDTLSGIIDRFSKHVMQ